MDKVAADLAATKTKSETNTKRKFDPAVDVLIWRAFHVELIFSPAKFCWSISTQIKNEEPTHCL